MSETPQDLKAIVDDVLLLEKHANESHYGVSDWSNQDILIITRVTRHRLIGCALQRIATDGMHAEVDNDLGLRSGPSPIMGSNFGRAAVRALSYEPIGELYEYCDRMEPAFLKTAVDKCKSYDYGAPILYLQNGVIVALQKAIGCQANVLALQDFAAHTAAGVLCEFYAGECFTVRETSGAPYFSIQRSAGLERFVLDLELYPPEYMAPNRPTSFMLPAGTMPDRTLYETSTQVVSLDESADVRGLDAIRDVAKAAYIQNLAIT